MTGGADGIGGRAQDRGPGGMRESLRSETCTENRLEVADGNRPGRARFYLLRSPTGVGAFRPTRRL